MERVTDVVANVFTESGIQIGTLSIEEHQGIVRTAFKDKMIHLEQLANAGKVFVNSFFVILKTIFIILGAAASLYVVTGGEISILSNSKLAEVYDPMAELIRLLSMSFNGALIISTVTLIGVYVDEIYKVAKKTAGEYFGYNFSDVEDFCSSGLKSCFSQKESLDIKRALQEQSDCKIVIRYQKSE